LYSCRSARSLRARVVQQGPARLIIARDDAGREFRSLFNDRRINVSLTDDFVTEAWGKLCSNAALRAALADMIAAISGQIGWLADAAEILVKKIPGEMVTSV
jgi:ketopantoate reductase